MHAFQSEGALVSAASLARLRASMQAALGALAMRRAVLNAIPLLLTQGGAVSGSDRDAVSGMFGSLALPDLHLLLKLAHAAGGARFEALLDGLRVLLRDLPLGMKRLPALLCEDALGHIHRSMASVAEVQSHHPLGPGCTSRQVQYAPPSNSDDL